MSSSPTSWTTPLIFHGTFIHSISPKEVDIILNGLLVVSQQGKIVFLRRNVPAPDVKKLLRFLPGLPNLSDSPVRFLTRGEFLIPGFVDTHNHAPQWTQRGMGRGLLIMDWLNKVTFPHEAKFEDPEYARQTYASCVDGFIKQGVTTAAYYGSLHGEATKILADTCLEKGQRALVGKCCMVRNAPDFYRDKTNKESLEVTEDFIAHVKSIDPSGLLVQPILTPRFAICCDEELLAGIGDIASKHRDMMIQTHFNEAKQEVAVTKELFPQFENEADLYEHFGLFNNRTIMAHCIYPDDYEIGRIKACDVGVAHCPVSNTTGGEWGAAPIRRYLDMGIKVGLGTDSGGGFSSSILDASRQAFIISLGRELMTDGKEQRLTLWECFYLATLGGAKVCCLADKIGTFETGKDFDALEVTTLLDDGQSSLVEEDDSVADIFEKFLMTGDDRNIAKVFVMGRSIKKSKQ
ncbi:guanine deaminase [Exophiala spinifera]|uniref:Probable guanine deaminase n=1 Tax=Exophiala spinifera TaxID=91928 RepID=A0A0D1ZF62_9EURO|nr:guanine deaminase [Exophiala spinifera]KIW11622.1 guanine deaminase [Exophiala spinifera]